MTNTTCLTASTPTIVPQSAHELRQRPQRHRLSETGSRWWSGNVGRFLWALLGVLIAVLTVGWELWFAPNALLEPGALGRPSTWWLSPAVCGAALSVWGCFSRAFQRPRR